MKSTSKKDVRHWAGNSASNREFKLFYLSGDLLTKLDELAADEEQSELIADLIREEHNRRFRREQPDD